MKKHKSVFLYGILLGTLIILLKLLEHRLFSRDISLEIYIGLIALLFTAIGVWVRLQILKKPVHETADIPLPPVQIR